MSTQEALVPLGEFWSRFFEVTSRSQPPLRDSATLETYFRGVFGDLTEHHFGPLETVPFRVECRGCSNNTPNRNAAVCETHLGILKGVFQAITHVPLTASQETEPGSPCRITLDVVQAGGHKVTAHAKRLSHIAAHVQDGRVFVIDGRTGTIHPVPPEDAAVLGLLDHERPVSEVVRLVRLPEGAVRAILDRCYAAGWVSCRFDVTAPVTDGRTAQGTPSELV